MATFTRTNPIATTVPFENVGKDLTIFTVDYVNAVNGSAGPEGAQAAVLNTIQQMHTVLVAGPLGNTNTEQTFIIEGPLFTPTNGTTLEAQLQALGTVDSVDLSSTTVNTKTFYVAV